MGMGDKPPSYSASNSMVTFLHLIFTPCFYARPNVRFRAQIPVCRLDRVSDIRREARGQGLRGTWLLGSKQSKWSDENFER